MAKVSPINGVPLPEGRRFTSGESARENGKKGAAVTNAKKARLKTLREELEMLLSETRKDKNGKQMTVQAGITSSLVKSALDGNTKAYEIIRDTIGQKPADELTLKTVDYTKLDDIAKRMADFNE